MNFLDLVKRLATETGTELESKIESVVTPPATAYGETTEHRTRLVRWTQQAWIEIQEDQTQWNFMVKRGMMPLVTGQYEYPIGNIVNLTCEEVIYDHLVPFVAPNDYRYIWIVDGSTEKPNPQICYYVPAEHFFGDRDRFNDRSFGMPSRFSIDRTGCIVFDVSPSKDDYHIEFEFKALPQDLLLDADELRGIPKKHHMVVVYKAMMFYAMFDEADKQVQRSSKLYRDWMNKLRQDQLKEYSMPGTRS